MNIQTLPAKIKILYLLLLLISQNTFAHFGSKGPFGGSVSTILVYDTTVYIGTFSGGVFQSTNAKFATWTPRPVGLKSGSITALAHTGKYLFAATADSGIYLFNSASADKYWIRKNNGLSNLKVTCLLAMDSVTLFAGTDGGGVFKTSDKGNTWTAVNNPVLHHLEITGLARKGSRIIQTALQGGVYASDDMGTSWIDFNDASTDDKDGTSLISYNPASDEIMVLNIEGLYKAAVGTTISPVYVPADGGLPEGIKITSIYNDGSSWYLTTDKGILISPSDSIAWTYINTGLSGSATAIARVKNVLIAGSKGRGIFKSAAPFTSWVPSNAGFNNLATYAMATRDLIVIAATEKGVYVSRDLATTYVASNNGLTDSLNVTDLLLTSHLLFATTKNQGIFVSTDTGKTWTKQNVGLSSLHIKKIIANSDDLFWAFSAEGQIFLANLNLGWSLYQKGLPQGVMPSSLAFAGNNLILTTHGNGVFVRGLDSDAWLPSSAGLSNLDVTSVAIQKNKIFIGTHGNGIFMADKSDMQWKAVTGSPTGVHTELVENNYQSNYIQSLLENEGYIFAAYRGGVFASADSGANWIPAGNQFNLPTYTSVNQISIAKGRVFASTENNGLYSNALSELPSVTGVLEGIAQDHTGLILYPNPCNGSLNIIDGKDVEEIYVYDLSGKLLDVFINPVLTLNLNHSNGMYYVRAKTKDGFISQKVAVE